MVCRKLNPLPTLQVRFSVCDHGRREQSHNQRSDPWQTGGTFDYEVEVNFVDASGTFKGGACMDLQDDNGNLLQTICDNEAGDLGHCRQRSD